MATDEEKKAVALAAQALIDACKAGGEIGAPGGVLYAALMDKLSLHQFETFMGALVRGGFVRKSGHCYHYVKDLLKAA